MNTMETQEVTPVISVCVPAYNAARYIGECIESVLAQTFPYFELLIVDDGSEDHTCEVVEKYKDPRIRLIRNHHDFIRTKNTLLQEAKGKYIAFLDSDDRMLPDRLEAQFAFMEEHPHIDALGGAVWVFGNGARIARPAIIGKPITLDEMIAGNQLFNPTVMLRTDRIREEGITYPEAYVYANDYALWMQMLFKGMHLENQDRIVTEYRSSENQISVRKREEQADGVRNIKAEAIRFRSGGIREEPTDIEHFQVPVTGNKLTLIIPFLNEREEVRNTVASARDFAGTSVDILVINDASDDGYNYRQDLEPYAVVYVRNRERLGVAASRDLGVSLCTTPYFLLLDAHMRFYENRWPVRIVSLLEENDRCILCCQSKVLHKENGVIFAPKGKPVTFGAYHPFNKRNFIPDIVWNTRNYFPDRTVVPIAAILGAGYAASVRYWNRLKGLAGLLHYGSDEAYLSFKTWLEGGQCLLLKDTVIGHLYRTSAPYVNLNEKVLYNHLIIAYLLFPDALRSQAFAIARKKNQESFRKALQLMDTNRKKLEEWKQYYQALITVPFEKVLAWNYVLPPEKERKIMTEEITCLPRIAEWLKEQLPADDFGLWYGKAGIMAWYALYARFSGEKKWDDEASSLWSKLYERVMQKRLPLNFAYGMCGVGWTALYLKQEGVLEDNLDDILKAIDTAIQEQDFSSWNDMSMATGCAGVLCYVTARLRLLSEQKETTVWTESKLRDLENCAKRILEDENSDLPSLNMAEYYLILRKEGVQANDLPSAFHDWMDYPNYLTEDSRFWKNGLVDGIAGYGLLIMSVVTHLKTSPYYGNNAN